MPSWLLTLCECLRRTCQMALLTARRMQEYRRESFAMSFERLQSKMCVTRIPGRKEGRLRRRLRRIWKMPCHFSWSSPEAEYAPSIYTCKAVSRFHASHVAICDGLVIITSHRCLLTERDVVHLIAYASTEQIPGVAVAETHWPRKRSCEILLAPTRRADQLGTLTNSWTTRDYIQDTHRQRSLLFRLHPCIEY